LLGKSGQSGGKDFGSQSSEGQEARAGRKSGDRLEGRASKIAAGQLSISL